MPHMYYTYPLNLRRRPFLPDFPLLSPSPPMPSRLPSLTNLIFWNVWMECPKPENKLPGCYTWQPLQYGRFIVNLYQPAFAWYHINTFAANMTKHFSIFLKKSFISNPAAILCKANSTSWKHSVHGIRYLPPWQTFYVIQSEHNSEFTAFY